MPKKLKDVPFPKIKNADNKIQSCQFALKTELQNLASLSNKNIYSIGFALTNNYNFLLL